MIVGVLLLAAGSSLRFGSDKRVATLDSGNTVLATTINNILATQLPLKVCLRDEDQHLAKILTDQNISHVLCRQSREGMGATLSEGISHVHDWDGVLIALADMPYIAQDTYTRVARALKPDNICLPTNEKGLGHPVGFGRKWFGELQGLRGDKGGQCIVGQNQDAVIHVPCDDANLQFDIDLPDALLPAQHPASGGFSC